MRLHQIDNRRIARARKTLQIMIDNINDRKVPTRYLFDEIRSVSVKFGWLMDQQSARIARRFGKTEFCGVPASFAVLQPNGRSHRSLL